jgi:hypothetical protein
MRKQTLRNKAGVAIGRFILGGFGQKLIFRQLRVNVSLQM